MNTNSSGERSAIISALGNLALSVFKILGGIFSGSVGLLTDGIHSLADVLSSVIVWASLRISAKPPDVEHPYGHYKAENIASLFVAFFIVLAGVETFWDSLLKIFGEVSVTLNFFIFSIPLISGFISLVLAEYKKIVGRRIGSPSLIAEGEHSLVDTFASFSVLIGLILYKVGFVLGDPLVGVLISVLILWRGIDIGKDSIYALMDTFRDPVVLEKIREVIEKIPGVIDVKDVKARSAGGRILVDINVIVPPEVKAKRLYSIQREILDRIKGEIPQIVQATIQIEPFEESERTIAVPVETSDGLSSELSDHFGKAPFIAFITLDENNEIEKLEIQKNKFLSMEKGIGANLAEYLAKRGIGAVIVKNIGQTSYKLLRSYGIIVYKKTSEHERLEDVIKAYISSELKILSIEDIEKKL